MSVGRAIERAQTIVGLTAVLAVAALPGCGPAPLPTSSSTTSTASPAGNRGAAGGGGRESVADGERQVAEHTDAQGRKWLGDVPYDVFFDDPVSVAAEGRSANQRKPQDHSPRARTPVGAGENPRASHPKSGTSLAEAAPGKAGAGRSKKKKAAGSSTDWSALIDPETLDTEVKQIRTELTAGLQSVGKYNLRYQEIAVSGATLAALAEIVAQSPRSVSWKEHAANARDLAAAIHDSAKALGSQAYQATKNSSDQLMDVLDGNLPAGLPTSMPMRDFAQVANRGALMKRMDRSFQRLKKGGTAQQLLKKDAGQAMEDAAILAVLSRVIAVGHYDSADDPKYREQAADLTRAASDLATAAKSGEAPAFADALTRIQKRCDACHADFRF